MPRARSSTPRMPLLPRRLSAIGGVHDARKCLKRITFLLVLIRPGLPDPVFLSLTERSRAIAKGLAPARDAQALLDAIDKIGGKSELQGESSPIRALRAWLHRRRQCCRAEP